MIEFNKDEYDFKYECTRNCSAYQQGKRSIGVCEWEYEPLIKFASSKCGGFDVQRISFKDFKYCPYCGEKIVVNGG